MKISSLTNPHVKNLIRLRKSKVRQEQGLTVVDGVQEVRRALEAGIPINEVYVFYDGFKDEQLYRQLLKQERPVYEVTRPVFEKIAFGERREGLVAVCAPVPKTFSSIPVRPGALFLVVEQLEKPGNLGAILRTCDGAGVDGVIVCHPRTDIYNPNCIRASLGSVFVLPVIQANPEDTLAFFRKRHVKIIATSPAAAKPYSRVDLGGDIAIVVGSEHDGLGEFWLSRADELVRIPMKGRADSLNVSVSSAVMLYEALRQRSP